MSEHPRITLLRYIEKYQPVAVTTMHKDLHMSIGSLYHHLKKLENFVVQDEHKRYMVSREGESFLRGDLSEGHDTKFEKVVVREELSKYDARGKLIRFIADNGVVSIKQIRDSLKMSVGSIYHHLSKLEGIVEQDEFSRYKLTGEGRALVGLEVKQQDSGIAQTIEIPAEILQLKTEQEFIPARVSILKFLYENPESIMPRIKDALNLDKNTVKRHLKKLSKYVTSDRYGRYSLSSLGKSLIARHNADYAEIYRFLMQEAKSVKRTRKSADVPGVRRYRTFYDLMAVILALEPVFSITSVIRKTGIASIRAEQMLLYMREKGLIDEVADMKKRRFRVSDKGRLYLKRYRELLEVLE